MPGFALWVRLGRRFEAGLKGHMRRRRFLELGIATVVAAASLLPGPAAACPVFPADGELDFLVLRHGVAIGSHRIRFTRAAGRFVVRSDIEFETAPPGAPPGAAPARYVHHAEEVWVGGWLHAVVSDTDDGGRRERRGEEAAEFVREIVVAAGLLGVLRGGPEDLDGSGVCIA